MGAGRRQRERAAVEKYQLESERGKHSKSPQIRGVSEWTVTQSLSYRCRHVTARLWSQRS